MAEDKSVGEDESPEFMNFSGALAVCKSGMRIGRIGWNGKNMFVTYRPGYPDGVAIDKSTAESVGLPEGTICDFQPYLLFCTAQGDLVPWTITQTDVLAGDWVVVR